MKGRFRLSLSCASVLLVGTVLGERVPSTVYDHSEPVNLPELLRTASGKPVRSVEEWENVRRPEILRFFTENMYGIRPVGRPADLRFEPLEADRVVPGTAAVRKRVRLTFSGPYGSWGFNVCAFVPQDATASKPAPAFVLIGNRDFAKYADPERKVKSGFFPVEEIVRRGYAAVVFKHDELARDEYYPTFNEDGSAQILDPPFTNGIYACWQKERTERSWGAVSVWAWGASRVLDWLETVPSVDARRVALVGHSRGGKTALWAAATDRRFAMACANDSGCCGAKLNHCAVSGSETIRQDNANNPHWFCRAFRQFDGQDAHVPFDQHWLVALSAPRPVCIASASADTWAGPWGEFLTARHASPAWALYGKCGLIEGHAYAVERPFQEGHVSYHLRKGDHDLTAYDWARYLDFADRHLKAGAKPPAALPPEAKYGFTFFRGNGEAGVYLATSADGFAWTEANGGQPILPATLGDRITRDPSVCLGPDGKYHMVFTTSWVNQGFGVTHSSDLLSWSWPEFVPVNDDWPEAKNTWAPEICWDAESGRYFVVWATSTTKEPKTRYHRQYCVTTADFTSWTHRAPYYDPGHSVIDAFPFRFRGQWTMIAKDETHDPVAHHLQVVRSKGGAFGPWGKEEKPFTDKAAYWAEGPTALELDDGRWVVYFDCYNKGRYEALVTRDFTTFEKASFSLPAGIRHGTAFRLRR